ncbi:MAG: S-layer homology domain-containing protein [Acidimicrobiaceae bacterium]|nr:S-layer homology domain-containing protein [Acidimicrobiaceae bacterium]
MPQLVKKRRSGWAVLAAGALVASLLAVGASPAAAIDDDSKPNAPAATSACVGDATGDMMFSDVSEMHAFRADINCLAYYGITVGYGDGTFRPNADVSNEEMVLFMERAAAAAGADAEAVVGDFAMSGSDPVHRGDMALLIARLLVAGTTAESAVNVENNADGTFTVKSVDAKEWDYFADSRSQQNRVHDSAASALYELGVAKGTGMGYFSPSSTVSRGAMAAFITRALAHTSARPEGVTIQSDEPGGVIISVRDANFHPVANAAVDVFSAAANKVGEAFSDDGSCYEPRLTGVGGNANVCEIDALDAVTGLSGDYDPGTISVNVMAGGTTVWAWTGENGDEVEDGGEGLASINLTETAPVSADSAKVTTDIPMGVDRIHFGDTVTVTIQLVGAMDADAVRDDGGNSYRVVTQRNTDRNIENDNGDPTAADASQDVSTQVLEVDASGKATFTITASDPDPTDRNNADGTSGESDTFKIDRVRVTFTITTVSGGQDVDDAISSTTSGAQTIAFSDARARAVPDGATITPTVDYLTRPMNGSASNVVTVTVVDQYGKGIRGHSVRLSSSHTPAGERSSTFPVARSTDSSGSVRIGYTYMGAGSVEALVANTSVITDPNNTPNDLTDDTETLTPIAGGTKDFYWAAPAGTTGATGQVLASDIERKTIIVAGTDGPQLVLYDDNDQYSVGASGSEELTSMAAFEEALAADRSNNDTVVVTSYDPTDSGDVARFVLTVVANT